MLGLVFPTLRLIGMIIVHILTRMMGTNKWKKVGRTYYSIKYGLSPVLFEWLEKRIP